MGASVDPIEQHNTKSSFEFVSGMCDQILDLFPFLSSVKINRQWAGMADMTPDFAPIMGTTPVDGFFLDSGWGTWGFKATPVSGKCMANSIAFNKDDSLITGFNLRRFEDFKLVGEKEQPLLGIDYYREIPKLPRDRRKAATEFLYGGCIDPEPAILKVQQVGLSSRRLTS